MSTADDRYLDDATDAFRAELARVIEAYNRAGRQPRLALGDPSRLARRAIDVVSPMPSPWDQIAGPFVRSEGVQRRLGISRQAVAAKAARRRLLRVVTADGDHLYPVWQFAEDRVVDGLPQLLAMFPEADVDGWTLAGWLRTDDPDLGEPPFDALRRGEVDRVHAAGRSAARSLAA